MNEDRQLKKEFLKQRLILFSLARKPNIVFSIIILSLAIGTFITLFLGDDYNFLNQCLATPCIWLAALRLFIFKLEFPNSRVIRWSLRLVLLLSIIHSILLVKDLVDGH